MLLSPRKPRGDGQRVVELIVVLKVRYDDAANAKAALQWFESLLTETNILALRDRIITAST